MRRIVLGDDAEKARARFRILHTAAFGGKPPADVQAFRSLVRVQEALEDVSHEETETVGGQSGRARVLDDGVSELVLQDPDHELLEARIFGAGIEWLPAAARRVLDVVDMLAQAETFKPEPAGKA